MAVVLANIIEELKAHPIRVGEQGPYDQAKVGDRVGTQYYARVTVLQGCASMRFRSTRNFFNNL